MLSSAFVTVILLFVCLAHAAYTDQDLPTLENIVALFKKFQSNPPFFDYYTIAKDNPIPWMGYEGNLKEALIKGYFDRFDSLDFDSFIESYKQCRDAGELDVWLVEVEEFCKDNIAKQLEFTIIASSMKNREIDVEDLTSHDLNVIQNSTSNNTISDFLDLINNFDGECGRHNASGHIRRALTCLLRSEKYLNRILVHALGIVFPGTEMWSIKKALPMLGAATRKSFLSFLDGAGDEYGGPFDMSNSELDYQCILKCEAVPVEFNDPNSACRRDEAGAICTLLGRFPDELFSIDDVTGNILSHVEWRTLMQSIPSVSKAFNIFVTKEFIIQYSRDLERYTIEQSVVRSPYQMVLSYPWNHLCPLPQVVIKYTVLKRLQRGLEIERNWLISIHSGSAAKEDHNSITLGISGEHDYPDNVLVKSSVLAKIESGASFDDDLSKDDFVRIMDIFLGDENFDEKLLGRLYWLVCYKSQDRLLYLLKHCKFGAKLFRIAQAHSIVNFDESSPKRFAYTIAAILVLDDLMMPIELEDAVKNYIAQKHGMKVSVPITAEELRAANNVFTVKLFRSACICKSAVSFKIITKLLSLGATISRPTFVDHLIECILDHPKALTVEQFKAIIGAVPLNYYESILKQMKSALDNNPQ